MAKHRFEEFAINSTAKKKPIEEDKYTYLGLEHLDPGTLKVTRFGSEVAPIGEKLIMKEGDVLFGKRRAYQRKVAIAPFDGIFSAHGMVLRPNEKLMDKDFFPLFISSDYFLDAAIKISVGSLSPTINWSDLKVLEFELPSVDEQRKLAKVLWAINDTMESYKKLILMTDELVTSQFIEMFGDVYSEQVCWNRVPFEKAFKDDTKSGTKIPKGNYLTDGLYPIIDQSQKFISAFRNDAEGLYTDTPSIIFGDHTRCLKYINFPIFLGADGVKLLKIKAVNTNSIFMYYQLRMANIPNTGYNRHYKWLKELMISLPPLDLQDQFAVFVQQSDKSKFELEHSLAELTAIYKGIITENLR